MDKDRDKDKNFSWTSMGLNKSFINVSNNRDTSWYLMVLGQYMAILGGTWWYWVTISWYWLVLSGTGSV